MMEKEGSLPSFFFMELQRRGFRVPPTLASAPQAAYSGKRPLDGKSLS
jgi:hypothetical protein